MDTIFPNIEVFNKFQVLADPVMEENTRDIIKEKPPPIIIKDKKNWPAISQLLKNTNSSSNKNFNDKDGIKMIFNEMTTFERCLQTFNKKKGMEIRAIFKGVAEDFSIEDITNDLKSKGFHPRVVARFKTEMEDQCQYLCIVPDEDQDIINLKTIMDIMSNSNDKDVKPDFTCYNCQKFGHTAHTAFHQSAVTALDNTSPEPIQSIKILRINARTVKETTSPTIGDALATR
ncbi:hypothetical protein JTB14_004999 [Gonioctena quinquepunctata]|nr:hypothetical protein JTB14_004999 [Gonioctena quinquepunctata]